MPKFRIVNVVWGNAFTQAFLDVCLPSQLSPGNLPALAARSDVQYWIYTTRPFAEIIQRSESYRRLAAILTVRVAVISGIARVGKYQAMNQSQSHFIRAAANEDCSLIFLSPDIVWADGAFARLIDVYEAGARNVAIGSVRLTKETFLPALLQRHGVHGVLSSVSARQLVSLALDHLHPVTRAQLWDRSNLQSLGDGELIWPVDGEGLVLRRFRLQPLMVTPIDRTFVPTVAVDGDFTDRVSTDLSAWYVVKDTDDMCYVDFTPVGYGRDYGDPLVKHGAPSVAEEAAWAREHALPAHRHFVRQSIRFHAGDCSTAWLDVEQRSAAVIDDILAMAADSGFVAVRPVDVPSARRFLSVAFWRAQLQRRGGWKTVREIYARGHQTMLRSLWGTQLTIHMAE